MIVPVILKIFNHSKVAGEALLKSLPTILTLVLLFGLCSWISGAHAAEKPDFQVIVEGGLAVPHGNLGEDFHADPLGFGATRGFEAGFRARFHLTSWLSLSPGFHFLNPGDFSSENDEIGEYNVQANGYRYTVELMVATNNPILGLQPFVAAGGGLYRNRFQGFTKPLVQQFDRSVNTLGYSARVGVRAGSFEFSYLYHFNRFNSYQFFAGDDGHDYNWDNMTLRLGWIIPFTQ